MMESRWDSPTKKFCNTSPVFLQDYLETVMKKQNANKPQTPAGLRVRLKTSVRSADASSACWERHQIRADEASALLTTSRLSDSFNGTPGLKVLAVIVACLQVFVAVCAGDDELSAVTISKGQAGDVRILFHGLPGQSAALQATSNSASNNWT